MRRLLAAFLIAAASAGLADRIPGASRAPSGEVGVAPTSPLDGAAWLAPADDAPSAPLYVRFRNRFASSGERLVFDVSADERYTLVLDGAVVGRGPDCGPVAAWTSARYAFDLAAGDHTLDAVVWRQGDAAPLAHQSWRLGFALKADGAADAVLTTGRGAWQVGRLAGTVPLGKGGGTFGAGDRFRVTGCGLLAEEPSRWQSPVVIREPLVAKHRFGYRQDGWLVTPGALPEQLSQVTRPGRFVGPSAPSALPLTVAPGETRTFLWDLEDYFCAYPRLTVRGGRGATVRWGWAEALKTADGRKGDRNAWQGKAFSGVVDEFVSDGRETAVFTTPWWRCGRWCEISITGGGEPVVLAGLELVETRYPLADEGAFAADDPSLGEIRGICARALEMCAHETFFDCPYYEQQTYGGDTRVEALVMSAMTRDDRLIRRALELFDASRRPNGMLAMNFPSRVAQESATYTLCALLAYGDFLRWHGAEGLKRYLPGLRQTLSAFERYETSDGLLQELPGWNYLDWVPGWRLGRPPFAGTGPDAFSNLLYVLALRSVAAVERAVGDPAFAAVWEARATRTGAAVVRRFWRADAGLMAFGDEGADAGFCEQVQALAIVADVLPADAAARALAGLAEGRCTHPASPYFRHYVFEALFRHGRGDLFLKAMDEWRAYVAVGGRCTFEKGVEFRSDCHAWSAHPLYWMATGLAGIRPAADGFAEVEIAPAPGPLRHVEAALPHPKGRISVDLRFDGAGGVTGEVESPVAGRFVWRGRTVAFPANAKVKI